MASPYNARTFADGVLSVKGVELNQACTASPVKRDIDVAARTVMHQALLTNRHHDRRVETAAGRVHRSPGRHCDEEGTTWREASPGVVYREVEPSQMLENVDKNDAIVGFIRQGSCFRKIGEKRDLIIGGIDVENVNRFDILPESTRERRRFIGEHPSSYEARLGGQEPPDVIAVSPSAAE